MSMTFSDIPSGASIYVDANVFLYVFTRKSADCTALIERCRRDEIFGLSATHVLAEVCHRAMGMESAALLGQPRVSAEYLKRHPDVIRRLTKYSSFIADVVQQWNLTIFTVSPDVVLRSQSIRDSYGLMTNDSISVQIVSEYGIDGIATDDPDFNSVTGITVYAPTDVRGS